MLARLTIALLATIMLIGQAPAGPDANPPFDKSALLAGLKTGGYVIYVRHAQTEKDYADQVAATLGDCSTQRTLSEKGWAQAREIGAAIAKLGIPVGRVISSEYCRAWQTADLAFGHYEKNNALNFEPAESYTDSQLQAMKTRVTPLLTAIPDPGTNVVLVGHDDPFEAATGIYPEPQGVAYVLQPNGNSFTILARIPADGWMQLGS